MTQTVRLREQGRLLPQRRLAETQQTAAPKVTAKPIDDTGLVTAFVKMGMTESHARIMARGRGSRPVPAGSLAEAGRLALGLSAAASRTFAHGRSRLSEVVKNVAGLSSKAFAFAPDENDPATWLLQICRSEDTGKGWSPDQELVKAAVGMLPGIAGYDKALDIPASALPEIKARLRAAWIACSLPIDEMPGELQQESLRRAFIGMGLSEQAATIAARGRARRS